MPAEAQSVPGDKQARVPAGRDVLELTDPATPRLVELGGDIDLANAGAIGDALCDAIHRKGSIVVDLSAVTFIDSSAIAMMTRVHQHAEAARHTVTWRRAQPDQRRVLQLIGADHYLDLAD
jgi:anti-sigma B factor antagonist